MGLVLVPQTNDEARARKPTASGFRPLDETDRVLEVRLEITPLSRGDGFKPVQVEVRDVSVASVAMPDCECRARHRHVHTEGPARTPDEGRLSGAELPGDGYDIARSQHARDPGADSLRLLGGGGGQLHSAEVSEQTLEQA